MLRCPLLFVNGGETGALMLFAALHDKLFISKDYTNLLQFSCTIYAGFHARMISMSYLVFLSVYNFATKLMKTPLSLYVRSRWSSDKWPVLYPVLTWKLSPTWQSTAGRDLYSVVALCLRRAALPRLVVPSCARADTGCSARTAGLHR